MSFNFKHFNYGTKVQRVLYIYFLLLFWYFFFELFLEDAT